MKRIEDFYLQAKDLLRGGKNLILKKFGGVENLTQRSDNTLKGTYFGST